jgi:hypothetical protein
MESGQENTDKTEDMNKKRRRVTCGVIDATSNNLCVATMCVSSDEKGRLKFMFHALWIMTVMDA